jgi:exosortase/archaeosortase family protein
VVVFFNIFRIVLTILLIVTSSLAIAEFMHGFLFRIFLIIIVIGFYYFWFKYSYKW